MNRMFFVVALALVAATAAEAGPLGLIRGRTRSTGASTGSGNSTAGVVYYDNSELFSAQGVANRMARLLRMGHMGNPTGGWEGVGVGGSPQQAISNCCYYGRRPLRDSGVAQGANGLWYACCRYN